MGTKFTPREDSFSVVSDLSEWIEILQAIAAGKTIQVYNGLSKDGNPIWTDLISTYLHRHTSDYRIKPEPQKGSGQTRVMIDLSTGSIAPYSPWLVNPNPKKYVLALIDYTWTEIQDGN